MDDYIKRSDAIMTAMNYEGSGNAQDASQDIAAEIASIPAADVRENVYADCIKTYDDPYIVWKCGNCGWIRDRTSKPKFCEECGAYMRGAKDGN